MPEQIRGKIKKPFFLLTLLLVVFFLKGLVFAALLPAFQGFDEPNHFRNAQYFSWTKLETNPPRPDNYNSETLKFDNVRDTFFNTQDFGSGVAGPGEDEMIKDTPRPNSDSFPSKYAFSPYARLSSVINRLMGDYNFLIRLFTLRIFSVILGTLIVWLVFLMARSAGFADAHSLLLAGIFAFQPVFTNVSSIVNYDIMLALAFALFIYAAVNLIKSGFSRKYLALAILATLIGVFTKGAGVILAGLFVVVLFYVLWKKYQNQKVRFLGVLLLLLIFFSILAYFFSPYTLRQLVGFGTRSHFSSLEKSLNSYYGETKDNFEKYSLTYWGNFGWINAPISKSILRAIWLIELVSSFGIIVYFARKKNSDFLPQKMILLFMLVFFLALQFGIRFADWMMFDYRGHLIYGTAGRYFIPALPAHLILIIVGLGALIKSQWFFEIILKSVFTLMVLLYCYSILAVIIPRYYL